MARFVLYDQFIRISRNKVKRNLARMLPRPGLRTRRPARLSKESEEVRFAIEKAYWPRVWESDGFDIDHLKRPFYGLLVFKCKPDDYYSVVLHLYAKMGLHQYNMLHGTNLQLHHIEKYNRRFRPIPASYYMTLAAEDPSISRRPVTFQTSVHEISGYFNVQCNLSRRKSEATTIKLNRDATNEFQFRSFTVPECWPSDDDLADKNRFYVVQESDLKENDWIRLYMELAFVTTHRWIGDNDHKLSDLDIVEVVVETSNPTFEKLKGAFNAFIYIEYKQDLGKDQFLKYITKIRRTVDVRNRLLSLVGDNQELGLVGHNQELGPVGDSQELSPVGHNQELSLLGDNQQIGLEPLERPRRSFQRRELLNCVYASDEARVYAFHKAEKLLSSLGPGFPSFVKPMLRSHVSRGFWLGLPRQFCMTHLPHCDEMLTLIDENDEEFPTKYLAKKNALSGGWRGFTINLQLIVGDVVVFRLINPTTFKVYIIRVCDEANNDSDSNYKENDVEISKKQKKSISESSKLRSSGERKRGGRK